MTNPLSFVLFILFAIILLLSYVGLRRHVGSPLLIAAGSVLASILLMLFVSLAEGNNIAQAAFTAVLVGGIFSACVLAIAYYFTSEERRKWLATQPTTATETSDVFGEEVSEG